MTSPMHLLATRRYDRQYRSRRQVWQEHHLPLGADANIDPTVKFHAGSPKNPITIGDRIKILRGAPSANFCVFAPSR